MNFLSNLFGGDSGGGGSPSLISDNKNNFSGPNISLGQPFDWKPYAALGAVALVAIFALRK